MAHYLAGGAAGKLEFGDKMKGFVQLVARKRCAQMRQNICLAQTGIFAGNKGNGNFSPMVVFLTHNRGL